MKTLRMARNIAALFILAMAVLGTRPATGSSAKTKACVGIKAGYNCSYDANFNCRTTKCDPGGPCSDTVCHDFCIGCK